MKPLIRSTANRTFAGKADALSKKGIEEVAKELPKTYIHTLGINLDYDIDDGSIQITKNNVNCIIVCDRKEPFTSRIEILNYLANNYHIYTQEKPTCSPIIINDTLIFKDSSNNMCAITISGYEWYDGDEGWTLQEPYSTKIYKLSDGTLSTSYLSALTFDVLYDVVN